MIKNWQDFLDSLATAGGNIVTLFWCSSFSAALWIYVYKSSGSKDLVMATFGVFTGFTGALLQAQKGNSSRQQMIDRKDAVTPPPTVDAGRVTNLTVNQPEKVVDSAPTKPLP